MTHKILGGRFGVEETAELLGALGLGERALAAFRENGVGGGDLLDLTPEEMRDDLGLAPLQALFPQFMTFYSRVFSHYLCLLR